MANLSIRGLDAKTAGILKETARRKGKSVNIQVIELLRGGLGQPVPSSRGGHTDLDRLAGTWSEKEAEGFARRTEAFEAVDEDQWR